MKKLTIKWWSNYHNYSNQFWKQNAKFFQEKLLLQLIHQSKNTDFGKYHSFNSVKNIQDFQKNVPIYDYESLKDYIKKIQEGFSNVLWKGIPLYLAKTSGTTSGTKYLPLTKASMPNHIEGIKSLLLNYLYLTKKFSLLDGKMIFLQGSPQLDESGKIPIGRLSGIVAHHVPRYLQQNRLPSWKTNCIEHWDTKINAIVEETSNQKITVIGGIPPWLIMYFEKLIEKNNKKVGVLFSDLQLIITGGVNYEPYRKKIEFLLGRKIQILQTFPASEGFFAYQDKLDNETLLLLTNHGIFYEFIALEDYKDSFQNIPIITIKDIELNKDYVLIITNKAGLWRYNTGDTIRFASKNPYKIRVTGRTTHYISAFGEHVIAYEVESALMKTMKKFPCSVIEFTVAPQINPREGGLPYHEWFIEFDELPQNIDEFTTYLDKVMQEKNIYYFDLIDGKILKTLKLFKVKKFGFQMYMTSIGKLGGQNKVPRLSNDRRIANFLSNL